MARCWYAAYWPFGVGVRHSEDNSPVCSVRVFDSKQERDAWVDADRFDQNWHRSAESRGFVLPLMRSDLNFHNRALYEGWDVGGRHYGDGELVAAWRAMREEEMAYVGF
ncbi:hypothetical protein [Bifidobacterium eulemuris]|uniref:Uncharacterized protein n=1 Tax=Bifidobacterium eulemuris TaxID=1765219 RepID=A0A261G9Z8_9BIFI|nr:hypothetical protein [Bifidobacterium eulemuris]OZG68261.1 hypothetical protein BEUL_1274 [Bifidobacterium eulemuris]QOL31684.1 hypothetical protein BE0216_03825 [Bifidobacterium eulemuris]